MKTVLNDIVNLSSSDFIFNYKYCKGPLSSGSKRYINSCILYILPLKTLLQNSHIHFDGTTPKGLKVTPSDEE